MKKLIALPLVLLAFCSHLFADTPAARPFVSTIIGEHMVLQRGKTNRVWGWTQPGAEVRLAVAGEKASAIAAADGRWQIEFTPPPAGGPYSMKIDGPEHVEFSDILVGDVWLCSGQSNMAFGLEGARNGPEVIKAAHLPNIRFFRVADKVSYGGTAVVAGQWKVCTPEALSAEGGFSAVAFFFGRKVQAETGIPIGLIQAAVGGTPAESWTSPETLEQRDDFRAAIVEMNRLRAHSDKQYGNYVNHWYDDYDIGQAQGWDKESFDDSKWKTTSLKTGFVDLGVPTQPAVCWFRTEVTLPDPLPAGTAKILLGVVQRMDTVFINGKWIGASSWVENPRAYPIPAGVLRPGKNQITVRVLKTKPDGGFLTPAQDLRLALGDSSSIPLGGQWKGSVSVNAQPPHPLPMGYENWPTMPSVLYLGMLQPITPLALTGALWYQGEQNEAHPEQYRTLLPAMIADWRARFHQGDFPFYLACLPAFKARSANPGEHSGWTGVREAQILTAQTVPNTGVAIIVDTGDANNIHPTEKQPVGERLALLALRNTYHRDVVCSGPTFAKLVPAGGALRIQFSHTEGGLQTRGARLAEFSVAGSDRIWHWAEARIDGDSVIVSSPKVAQPVAVRYAWQDNPEATLFNGAGLPAVPFRSDDWEVVPPTP